MTEQVLLWENIVSEKVDELRQDCVQIFNSRAISANSENYSTGSTYFVKANETPRTGLEQLALSIFQQHTKGMTFDPETSGAEWWSQVIDPWDDIGIHWDRDYGIEESLGQHIYPHVGTVTYFTDIGAPTVVFDKVGTETHVEEFVGPIQKMIVSKPAVGNHIRFLGNLLHAAPADLLFQEEDEEDDDDDDGDDEKSVESLKTLLAKRHSKRISFLVNIWVDHIPSQAKRCPKNVISKLNTVLESKAISFEHAHNPSTENNSKTSSSSSSNYKKLNKTNQMKGNEFPVTEGGVDTTIPLQFNNSDTNYDVFIPTIPISTMKQLLNDHHNLITLKYPDDLPIMIQYGNDSDEEEGDDGSEAEEEEDGSEGSEESEEEEVVQPAPKKRRK
jgi:hypothetical protein